MKILILLSFFSGLAQSSHPRDKCWLQCDPKDYIALLTCSSIEGNSDSCLCEDGDHAPCTDGNVNGQTGPMTWNECHDLAKLVGVTDAILENKFFRWENKEAEEETHCYLIPETCTPLPPGDCYPYDGAPCVAGQSDVDCEPAPEVFCDAPEWDDDGLHWTCVGPSGDVVNAYTLTGKTIPMGTTCHTGKIGCETWTWENGEEHEGVAKEALVQCEQTAPDSDTGIWNSIPPENMLLDIEIGEDGSESSVQIIPPHDGTCRCPLLEITEETYNTPGLSLLCDQVYKPEDGGINYDNACTLLCDGHFKMYIECIKGQWKNTGAGFPFGDVTTEDITC